MLIIFYLFLVFFMTFLLVGLIKKLAMKKEILDFPDHRSSHVRATPHIGGIAIVIVSMSALLFAWVFGLLETNVLILLMFSTLIVACVGLLDDLVGLSQSVRLLIQFGVVSAVVLIYGWNLISEEFNGFYPVIITLVSVVSVTWLLNLYNFMDGIDGLAAVEGIFVTFAASMFTFFSDLSQVSFILAILSCSILGFLIWNWPPAKIFMGDVGSNFLGCIIGICAFMSVVQGFSIWVWLILLASFVSDATYTLVLRIVSGQRWYRAHCLHAYQKIAKKKGHRWTMLSISAVNYIWLLPLAFVVYLKPEFGLILAIMAYVPLIIVINKVKAGILEDI